VVTITIISAVIGVAFGHAIQTRGYTNFLGSSKKSGAPSKVTSLGPAQANEQFSTYPTWAQNFANAHGQPDPRYWNIFQGEPPNDNKEAQYYTASPANVHIDHGVLSLVATHEKQPNGYQYASARIDTENKLSFLYGRMDVTAKLPSGIGTWPAVWFLPSNTKYKEMSPASDPVSYVNGGEMDMMEAVGFNPDIVYGVVHTRTDLKNPDRIGAFNQIEVGGNDRNYNLYTILWTPTSITYEVNNTPYFTYTKSPGADYTTWPFDQPFHMIMNLAMGGNWGGEDIENFPGNGIDNSALPASLDIKSIYYYPYIGSQSK
jgi:beta-glucanase (GH16 family)